jgi:hypothetical protein
MKHGIALRADNNICQWDSQFVVNGVFHIHIINYGCSTVYRFLSFRLSRNR